MKVDNPLSRKFLTAYPVDAARVLENLTDQHVAALFDELPTSISLPVINAMLPEKASACFMKMSSSSAAKIVAELPVPSAARIYRFLVDEKQKELSVLLSDKTRSSINRYLSYPATSAGSLLDPDVDLLPENITVADAIRRVEHAKHAVICDIYIINDSLQLVGVIDLGKLLISKHHDRLRTIMSRKTHPILAYMSLSTLLNHPGWSQRRRLPVVERDNTIVGVLDHKKLLEALGEYGLVTTPDPMDNFLSLASLYWLSLAQLLNSLFSNRKSDSGEE